MIKKRKKLQQFTLENRPSVSAKSSRQSILTPNAAAWSSTSLLRAPEVSELGNESSSMMRCCDSVARD